eukprot:TRINITY_DN16247_c0_g1_i1.p1 TRINITY_DN16247_c0_g1~~TRINITY_DN16247_c0_g1_i1.p1  ORF type:complete len:1293 (+),score=346.83 TRINITY_DN16247_c0_g1_i1:68-3946(+)
MIRRPPRSTLSSSSAASDVYKRQPQQPESAESSEGKLREDPALLEIRSLLQAEEFGDVADILDGIDHDRREHITCMLRRDQLRSGVQLQSLRASSVKPSPSPIDVAVVVFSARQSPLLQICSCTLSPDSIETVVSADQTVSGDRNSLHLLGAHSNQDWALATLRQLLPAYQGVQESLVKLLISRDSGGRTPFFTALETGNVSMALLFINLVESCCSPEDKVRAVATMDLCSSPPLHALLGLSLGASALADTGSEIEISCAELIEKMMLLPQIRSSRDLNSLSALEAYAALGPEDREPLAIECARSLHAVQAALGGECAAVDSLVWNLVASQAEKQRLARAVIETVAKLLTLGMAQMTAFAERWVQAVVRVLTTIFAGAHTTRDTSDPLWLSLVGALHSTPEAAIKILSHTASSVLKPMQLGMPLVTADQPGSSKSAHQIGRTCFGGQVLRQCFPSSSSKHPAVTVLASSSQRSAQNVLLADPARYWQSNGQMNSHWLEFQVNEAGPTLRSLQIHCSVANDVSFSPQEICVSIGETIQDAEGSIKVLGSEGWTELLDQPVPTPFTVHMAFVHSRGHNIKVRKMKLEWQHSCAAGSLTGMFPDVPQYVPPAQVPPSHQELDPSWSNPVSHNCHDPAALPSKSIRQDPRIVCASTFNFLVRTMVEIYKSAFVAKDEASYYPIPSSQSSADATPKSPTTMGILNKARGALRSKRIEDAMLAAGYQLDSSWEWIFHVMDSTQAHLKAAEEQQGRPDVMTVPAIQGGLLACLRASHGDVLSVAPNVTEHNYGHVAIVLDAIVAWQSCGVQEWLHKDRMMRNVSHLRKVTDPIAEIARGQVEAKSPPREAITSQPWKEQGLVDILARWERAIAKFANEFSEAEAVVGPDSFLHLMASYEKKEKRFRTEMAQLRREKCEGRKLMFSVSRDTSNIFDQVSHCMDLRYAEALAQNNRDHPNSPVPVLSVQSLVAKFEGELGEGSALLRSCLAQVAKVLRFDQTLLLSDQGVEAEADAQEQLRHFSPSSCTTRSPERLQKFRNIGRLLGLSLLFDCRLPVFFHRHVYKYLLGRRVSLADLAYYKGEVYTSMTNLIQIIAQDPTFDIQSMNLEFSAQWTPDGNTIPVTRNNWAAYVRRFAKGEMIDGVKLELENMKLGLLDVVPEKSLLGLTAEDLQLLLAGKSGNLSAQDFAGRVHFVDSRTAEGRENDLNELADLESCVWGVLDIFSVDERLSLIAFATGTPVLPEELGFHLEDPPSSSAAGPFARQCENYITIPSYQNLNKDLLANVLRNAARTTVRYDTI